MIKSFTKTLSLYFSLFVQTWKPSAASREGRYSLFRLVVMALFWPIFALVEAFNGFCMLLDYLLFPRFRQVEVRSPLFVVGVPRSGTTFLHRLLAKDDDRFTSMTLAELIFAPAITQKMIWRVVGQLDQALGGWLRKFVDKIDRMILGGLDDVHQTGLWSPEEDYLGLIPTLGCFILVLPFPFQSMWRLSYFDRDIEKDEQDRILNAYHRLVQRHLYFKGEQYILLSKNPSFTPMICGLSERYTDGRFIGCFRNPTKAIPSQINSMLIGARLFDGRVDDDFWRDGLTDMLKFYYRHLLAELPRMPQGRGAISVMEKLAKEPLETVESLYQQLNLEMTEAYREQLILEEEKAKRYQSNHQYSLEQLSISKESLVKEFGFVYKEFGFELPITSKEMVTDKDLKVVS